MGKSGPAFRHTPATRHGAPIPSDIESIDDRFRAGCTVVEPSQSAAPGSSSPSIELNALSPAPTE
jgi:hypothetical protein